MDFIIDIGGQDMKCFKIRNGAVDSIMLNEACSSGCGSFIETFAKALGYNIADFAKLGLFAEAAGEPGLPLHGVHELLRQAGPEGRRQRGGHLRRSRPSPSSKTPSTRCMRASSADELGQHIVVQGGTFHNDAVLRAFEQELGRNVTRPTIAGLMGAFGAALAAKDLALETEPVSSPPKQLEGLPAHQSKPITCNGCTNHCSLTINLFDGGRRFISGNRCSKPAGRQAEPTCPTSCTTTSMRSCVPWTARDQGDGSRGKHRHSLRAEYV